MKNVFLIVAFIWGNHTLFAQEKYVYTADIKNITNDQVKIELVTPKISENEIVFSFPKVIPGSYSQKNYGKYIVDFKVTDEKGKELKAKKINENQYRIANASKIAKITYRVNDTWDTREKDFVFQPGGSNIEAGKNVVMNNHAFFGYFEGYMQSPFEVIVNKPAEFYGSTHLNRESTSPEQDKYSATSYNYLADNPVIYSRPDTTSFVVGETKINVSVYSATGKVSSAQVADYLKPMAVALQEFFNGLPVDSYQFLFYFEDPEKALTGKDNDGGGYGALEHNYSSLYFLPETSYEPQLKSMVNDVASHEFLHILTPLNLHSEEIEYFNFVEPKMSRHLWLYEGVTEYFSNLVQLKSGLITEKKFFKNMQEKIEQAEEYGNFSMTGMSQHVLDSDNQKKYSSVYNRGALIGLMLDVLIREKTSNQKDLKSVITSLTKKYGPGKPFKDSVFLAEFIEASHPDVQDFVARYIDGEEPLPYTQYFQKLGYEFSPVKRVDAFFAGRMGLKYVEEAKAFAFTEVESKNALNIKNDDQLIAVENISVTDENLEELWEKYFLNNSSINTLSITVKRGGVEKVLSGPLYRGYAEVKNYLQPVTSANPAQSETLTRFIAK